MKLVAAGDSWNAYPKLLFTGGGLADHLAKLLKPTEYINIAHPGDATIVSVGLTDGKKLEASVPGADILLFSGGGDDIAGDQFQIWIHQKQSDDITTAIHWNRLNAALDLAIADYEELTEIRDTKAPDCLIVTHSYDFPVKSKLGKGVLWLGPWLKPGLDYCGWTNLDEQVAIVKLILNEFNNRLAKFAATNRKHLHVNTQGILGEGDWQNEIHPNHSGWQKVAQKIYTAIQGSQ
jgi:hypothetical protein